MSAGPEPEPSPSEPEPPAPERPLHVRLATVGARSLAVWLCAAPMGVIAMLDKGLLRGGAAWLVVGLALACLFACERRDAAADEVLLRSHVAACLAVVLVPLAAIAVRHPGAPDAAIAALGRELDGLRVPLGIGLLALLWTPFAFVWLFARASGVGRAGQIVSALVGFVPVGAVIATLSRSEVAGWALLLSAPAAALALERLDPWLSARDPAEPPPRPRRRLAALGLGCGTLGLLPVLGIAVFAAAVRLDYRSYWSAGKALREIHDAQLVYHHEHGAFAGNLGELDLTGDLGDGVVTGYALRLVSNDTGTRWAAAADPLHAKASGALRYQINQAGILYEGSAPAPLDAATCVVPPPLAPGWKQAR